MIIEIPDDNSIVKWKYNDKDEWKVAEISDLIKAYERPQGDLISRSALKEQIKTELANVPQPDTDAYYYIGVKQGLKFADAIINNAPTVTPEKALMNKLKGGAE